TGQRPFDGSQFDIGLAVKICQGERPKFNSKTPNLYAYLANRCLHSVPSRRISILQVTQTINDWVTKLNTIPPQDPEEIDDSTELIK
ncbi:16840_t:CDS:1, partial [Cetraspora pellucida]